MSIFEGSLICRLSRRLGKLGWKTAALLAYLRIRRLRVDALQFVLGTQGVGNGRVSCPARNSRVGRGCVFWLARNSAVKNKRAFRPARNSGVGNKKHVWES